MNPKEATCGRPPHLHLPTVWEGQAPGLGDLGPCFGISLDTLPLSGSIFSRFTEKCKERLEVASPGGRLTTTPSERLPSAAPVTETSARLVPLRPEGGDAVEQTSLCLTGLEFLHPDSAH